MRILKFGGKSLSDIKKTQKICNYIKKIYKDEKKLIIIVSAMGSTTNDLIELLKPFKSTPRELDVLLSTGETLSSSVFASILNSVNVPAKSFQAWQIKIKTYGTHQNSLISSIDKHKLDETLNQNIVAVVAGFQGVNSNEDITTLGRGGSDTTACALGAIYNTNVELYSDFNGLFYCDPRDISTKKINRASLVELDKLTSCGSKIVSNRAVKIAKQHNLSLILKSSTQPNLKGSIVNDLEKQNILISSNSNLCEISLNFSNELKLRLLSKNVLFWLNKYKLYNYELKNQKLTLLVNESDKPEILNILCKKLKLLKN